MENTEDLLRRIIQEEIENLFEDSAATSKALADAKDRLKNDTERMEDESGLNKLLAKEKQLNTKKDVHKKAASHLKELDKENKVEIARNKIQIKQAQQAESEESSGGESVDIGL